MEQEQRLAIFRAQTANVRELEIAWKHINRQINSLILQKQHKSVEITTKLLALIYCAFAEALFSKLLHTPYGLELEEIHQIKEAASHAGVKSGWLKCAELAIRRIDGAKSNHAHNVKKKLGTLIERYIFDPSLIRNKLAHGQWSVALNSANISVNDQLTKEIREHSVIELYRRKYALEQLALILEDIIESPNKAHRRDYWTHLTKLEDKHAEMDGWTLENKIAHLFRKKSWQSGTNIS
jgi:hypothetical protein